MNTPDIPLLDHGYLRLVETWGSDERVVEAARMSTAKGFLGWGTPEEPGDERLLRYLYEHKHSTPFEMAGLVVEVQAPIFVFREWQRHRTQSFNEMSARYTELPEQYYIPSTERLLSGGQAKKNKQASGEPIELATARAFQTATRVQCARAFGLYREMIGRGFARELARLVLPVNTYSRMRASANLRNWLAFLTLRTAPDAQWEIRAYARAIGTLVAERFPRTWDLFVSDHSYAAGPGETAA